MGLYEPKGKEVKKSAWKMDGHLRQTERGGNDFWRSADYGRVGGVSIWISRRAYVASTREAGDFTNWTT